MTLRTLRALARAHGVATEYGDPRKRGAAAPADVLLAVLQALGVAVRRPADAAGALREHRAALRARLLPPVLVAWNGRLRLPAGCGATLTDEHGREVHKAGALPFGYYELEATQGRRTAHSFVISAPVRAFTGTRKSQQLGWFAPIYALRSGRNFGIGDFTDLEGLMRWARDHGGSFVGTLPFLAQHLDEPFDPSPYSPASRLFWNELYLDLERAPEMLATPRIRALLDTVDMQKELRHLRTAGRVEYRRVVAIKQRVLALLAGEFFAAKHGTRHAALEELAMRRRDLDDYAEFRGKGDARLANVHRYAQLLCEQQVESLGRDRKVGLYLDLPIGANRESYDLWRYGDDFALDATVGAPPDAFFTGGQSWGFPPPHPERARTRRYRYLRECLAHQMRHAEVLRIDHVMGLHRLFWIPPGGEPKDGLYVGYPHDELYAILCVESHRAKCEIAGEDLGVVPDAVRVAMQEHGLSRLWVLPWELGAKRPNAVPRDCIAQLDTHDMLPFASLWASDPRLRKALGLPDGAPAEGFDAALAHLRRSKARRVLVNVEDTWLETEPQNVPGTSGDENWSRKCRSEVGAASALGTRRRTAARASRK